MKTKSKMGVTLVSLVLYLALFTGFTVFVSVIMTNLNNNLFDRRGEAINYSNLNKLQYNIENSSKNSNDINIDINKIEYSNGDIYTYDAEKKILLKNGGILCMNVDDFTFNITEVESGKKLELEVSFNKYLNVVKRDIITFVEAI